MIAALLFLAAAPLAAQPQRLEPTPAAQRIFESDWVLMNWALKYYDADTTSCSSPARRAPPPRGSESLRIAMATGG
jgi:hypothetical protein